MRRDFFPDREPEMVAWGHAFACGLSEREGHFGLPLGIVAEMVQAQAELEQVYRLAKEPATRTKGAVARKNAALRKMERLARAIARQLSGYVHVTDADRQALGLTVRRQRVRHVAPPSVGPELRVLGIKGADVTIRLIDAERPSRRARPDNATGATIFYYCGEREPTEDGQWKFAKSTTRTKLTLHFNPALPVGTPIWITAWWKNRRAEPSPAGTPVRFRLGEATPHPDRRRRATIGATIKRAQPQEQSEAQAA